MPLVVRPARKADRAAPHLLYLSAEPYYDAYAGSRRRALRVLEAIWDKPDHTASWDRAWVAERDGAPVGAMVAFASAEGDHLARRFLRLSVVRMPLWRWPGIVRHLQASAEVTPVPPQGALYVDALAVDEGARRGGVATALLERAEHEAARLELTGVALDTGLHNTGAQALYEGYGFERGRVHAAPNEHVARAVGGPGFVSYFKALPG
jgi:ribosomal protein S18 acetylase RimI-like enzyme